MHECPECGQACDCDGEDVWNDIGSSDWLNCSHECELDIDDEEDFDDGGYEAWKESQLESTPSNNRLQPTAYGAGGQSKIPLQGSLFAEESSATNGGG